MSDPPLAAAAQDDDPFDEFRHVNGTLVRANDGTSAPNAVADIRVSDLETSPWIQRLNMVCTDEVYSAVLYFGAEVHYNFQYNDGTSMTTVKIRENNC